MKDTRPQEVWICDVCSCGHPRLDHFMGSYCKHKDCYDDTGINCPGFELKTKASVSR